MSDVHADTRAPASCELYLLPGPEDAPVMLLGEPVCTRCGWHRRTHHQWEFRYSSPKHWQCRVCGRTAYTPDAPTDYPPCSPWTFDGDTD